MAHRNWWKVAFFTLLVVTGSWVAWWAYWHERWHDAELYYLRQTQTQVVQWINLEIAKQQQRADQGR